MHAFRCALSLVSLVFGEVYLLVVHPYMYMTDFCTFWKVLFLQLVLGGDGMKGFGVLWSVDVIMSGVGR